MVFTSKWTIFSPGIHWEGSLGSWKSILYEKRKKKYCFKSGYLGARTPQTLFLNMYGKWYPNVFGVFGFLEVNSVQKNEIISEFQNS